MSGSSPTSPSNVEVTQDDFRRVTFTSGDSPPPPRNELLGADQNSKRRGTMARRLGNILAKKASRNKAGRSDSSNVSVSAINDNATLYSMEGQQSVAAVTVHSQVTVKASNKHEKIKAGEGGETSSKPAKGWKKLKRLVGVKDSDEAPPRERLKSIDSESEKSTKSLSAGSSLWSSYPLRNRVLSVDGFLRRKTQKGKSKSRKELTEQSLGDKGRRNQLDLAIRGRLDGIDVLSLGSVNRPCLPPIYQETSSSPVDLDDDQIDLDPLRLAFTEIPTACTTSEIVSDMIWASAGKDKPELIFEGFIPGGGDRWVVRLEEPLKLQLSESASNNGISSPKRTTVHDNDDESTAVSTDDGSTKLPVQKLWNNLWGDEAPPPAPSHMQLENDGGESDDVIQLAAACSVPIDLDEDTFIIDSPEHLRSVHDLATIRIQGQRFDATLSILNKLLKGLEGGPTNSKFEHLIGCTHHNIGIIHMCKGDFGCALESFHKAVIVRTRCLPQNHPDVTVSLVRQGTAHFALGSFDEAVKSFDTALGMFPAENATRAKILNNLGVAHYQCEHYSEALKALTLALEIQRQWLDGPVVRESIVYDASVTLGNMGNVYLQMGDYDLSYFVFEEACLLQTTVFRKDHDCVLTSLNSMALIHAKTEQYEKALQIFRSILRSQDARFGPDSEQSTQTKGMVGFMLFKMMEIDEGLKRLRNVSNWQDERLPAAHPSVHATKHIIQIAEDHLAGKTSVWI